MNSMLDTIFAMGPVIAPTTSDGVTRLEPAVTPLDIALRNPRSFMPAKQFLIGDGETLLTFKRTRTAHVCDHSGPLPPTVLFGLAPCDVRALRIATDTLLKPIADPYVSGRLSGMFVVGTDCIPGDNCFCADLFPLLPTDGFDLFLTQLGDETIVQVASEKGLSFIQSDVGLDPADRSSASTLRQHYTEKASDGPLPPSSFPPQVLVETEYDHPYWDEVASRCTGCASCIAVCPTCTCFDIRDVAPIGAGQTYRKRYWDGCINAGFARVAGGRDFRPTIRDRLRYRLYHKFRGYGDSPGTIMCVGCGRCIDVCPAAISPRDALIALSGGLHEET